MRDDQRNYVIVGAFVIAVTVGLVVWIAVLAGRTGATDDYHAHFANVMGLSSGTQVLYQGYPVGMIEDIRPAVREGLQVFRLDLSVERGWPIPEDSVVTITASGLLSAVVVNVQAGASADASRARQRDSQRRSAGSLRGDVFRGGGHGRVDRGKPQADARRPWRGRARDHRGSGGLHGEAQRDTGEDRRLPDRGERAGESRALSRISNPPR